MNGPERSAEQWVRTIGDVNWQIKGVVDHGGDGKTDLVWRNGVTGDVYLWLMDGSTVLQEIPLGYAEPVYDIVAAGVFKREGWAGLIWRNRVNGEVWLWHISYDLSVEAISSASSTRPTRWSGRPHGRQRPGR